MVEQVESMVGCSGRIVLVELWWNCGGMVVEWWWNGGGMVVEWWWNGGGMVVE